VPANIYRKGDVISLASRGIEPGTNASVGFYYGDALIKEDFVVVGENGVLEYSYNISFLDPSGNWTIKVLDDSVNVKVNPSAISSVLLVTFTSPVVGRSYSRTSDMFFRINLTQDLLPVSGASCRAYFQEGVFDLVSSNGEYSYDFIVPYNAGLGDNELVVSCFKDGVGGENRIVFEITKANIQLLVLKPNFESLRMGETVPVELRVSYRSGRSLVDPFLLVNINDYSLDLTTNNSIDFYGEYVTSLVDRGFVPVSIIVSDGAGNSVSQSFSITITGELWYLIRKNLLLIIIVAAGIIFAVGGTHRTTTKIISDKKLVARKSELIELEKKAQKDYYNRGVIDKETYEGLMEEYESEVEEINDKLKKLKTQKKKSKKKKSKGK
jgi:hypothetical protein